VDVRLSEEQRMLAATAAAVAASIGVRQPAELETFDVDRAWSRLARTGVLALGVPDAEVDEEAGTLHLALVAEQLARHAVPAPYLGSAGLATSLLAACDRSDDLLKSLADGEVRATVCLTADLSSIAEVQSGDAIAYDALGVHQVLAITTDGAVMAREARGLAEAVQFDPTRLALALKADAADGRLAGWSACGRVSAEFMQRWRARALALVCADMVGAMQGALDLMVSYAKVRRQFGAPIGSFQAIQHLCADQAVHVEAARSYLWFAAWAADREPPEEALRAAASAKAYCSDVARRVGEACVQVHGGIGITWECQVHLYLKRLLVDAVLLGDAVDQLERLASQRYGGQGLRQVDRTERMEA